MLHVLDYMVPWMQAGFIMSAPLIQLSLSLSLFPEINKSFSTKLNSAFWVETFHYYMTPNN